MLEIQSVTNAIKILNEFTAGNSELGVSEIAKKLAMDKATVARLMHTLEIGEILRRVDNNGKYKLGVKVVELAGIFLYDNEPRKVALPYMKELHAKLQETIDLSILDGSYCVCIERLESTHVVRAFTKMGKPFTLHAGAASKVLLAFLPDKIRDTMIATLDMPRYTSTTITDRDVLRKELAKIRQQGFSISHEERVELVRGVAAPVRNRNGAVIAALGIWGLFNHFSIDRENEFIRLIVDAAGQISRDLGYVETNEAVKETVRL